ncbi:MAG: hypothetical protein M3O28_04135 [Actinomycetota bacterium]|nr:hypothetical protein [Actinomycetota bacterium]
MLRVLVDADNVSPIRLQPVLDVLVAARVPIQLTASGRQGALDDLHWPTGAQLLAHTGWQRADVALARQYRPTSDPLLLVSGDGDFALLAARHPAPVLVISGAASQRLREVAMTVDPAVEGLQPVRDWLRAQGLTPA